MKKLLFVLLLSVIIYLGYSSFSKKNNRTTVQMVPSNTEITDKRIQKEVKTIKEFAIKNPKYNSEIVFLVDMKIPSGKNRFFVYDLKKDFVADEGLVAHGVGSETEVDNQLKFSNVNNSLATSLGKYSIGASYNGQFGKAYKLYGLDTTNSNAFQRNIVLHKYSKMPYEEQIEPVCNSYGCPMVNGLFYARLEKIIDASEKAILLKIYY